MNTLQRLFLTSVLGLACFSATPVFAATPSTISDPLSNAHARITKKFFGTFVTKTSSPVMPERFHGYHTGIDLETTSDEATVDVPVTAACTGRLRYKNWVSGYGGVAIQNCVLNGKSVTLLYGHIRYSSIKFKVGYLIHEGDQLAILGTGYSRETDGERKHLHFAIHRGASIVLLGYVQHKSSLVNWLDPMKLLK